MNKIAKILLKVALNTITWTPHKKFILVKTNQYIFQEPMNLGYLVLCFQLSNEDVSRIASRIGEDYVKSLLAVQMLLPGTSSSYYGDEIAMKDGVDGNMDPASKLPGQVCFVKMDFFSKCRENYT